LPPYLLVESVPDAPNSFIFNNKSDATVFVSYKDSVADVSGTSHRVVSGTMRQLHADQSSPDTPIAARTKAEISFYMPDDKKVQDAIFAGNVFTLDVAIRKPGRPGFDHAVLRVQGQKPPDFRKLCEDLGATYSRSECAAYFGTPISPGDRWGCYLTGILYGGWCWFVNPDESDYAAAKEIAVERLGPEASLDYRGKFR
jgi:hypothetical protein